MELTGLTFAKGHGTGNDFVILPDRDGALALSADLIATLCDRRRGLGGDGLLRVVRAAAHPEAASRAGDADWFMDYYNADGSLAEMCGNGVRVFARYLVESGLDTGPRIPILTRSGLVIADVGADTIAVDLPPPRLYGQSTVHVAGKEFPGTVVVCGNPNLVCWVDDPSGLDLRDPPDFDPAVLPAGANVEFVAPAGELTVRMRVVERGIGETLSCGSGACAAAAVVLRDAAAGGSTSGRGAVTVEVPGGRLTVMIDDDRCVLAGPAVIVATGTVSV